MDIETEIFTMPANWDELGRKLKSKFEHLTDGDVKFEIGKENELLACIASRLHLKRSEVISLIRST